MHFQYLPFCDIDIGNTNSGLAVPMDVALLKRWKAIEALLRRARAALPRPTPTMRARFEASIGGFDHYVDHNELELAFDELCTAAELVRCRGGVWRDLERAARMMKLDDRLPYLRE